MHYFFVVIRTEKIITNKILYIYFIIEIIRTLIFYGLDFFKNHRFFKYGIKLHYLFCTR